PIPPVFFAPTTVRLIVIFCAQNPPKQSPGSALQSLASSFTFAREDASVLANEKIWRGKNHNCQRCDLVARLPCRSLRRRRVDLCTRADRGRSIAAGRYRALSRRNAASEKFAARAAHN